MKHVILVCEGKRDRVFFHEMAFRRLGLDHKQIKTYRNEQSLSIDIGGGKQTTLSIVEGNGFPGCVRVAVHLSRNLWFVGRPQSIGVIADSDRGNAYDEMVRYLEEFLATPCKLHNIRPKVDRHDDKRRVNIRHDGIVDIDLWSFEVPVRLDTQISSSLKRKYKKQLDQYESDDEIMKAACQLCDMAEEEAIRISVKLLEKEEWLKNLSDVVTCSLS